MNLRFAECELDLVARRFFRAGRELHLSPKAFELLKVLVECRPRALAKSELLDRVWPGVFVSDASLARVVNEVREAIGDRAGLGRIVRTVHRFGYAFAGEVETDAPQTTEAGPIDRRATCWLIARTREIALHEGAQIAGRDADAAIRLDSTEVSRHHARFVVRGVRVSVADLGSKNGTFVRGVRIAGETVLDSGDSVRIGPDTFIFRVDVSPGSTETAATPVPTKRGPG